MSRYTAYIIELGRQDKAGYFVSGGSEAVKAMAIEDLRKNLIVKYGRLYQAIHVIRLLPTGFPAPEQYMLLMAGVMGPNYYWSMKRKDKRRVITKTWILNEDGTLGRSL